MTDPKITRDTEIIVPFDSAEYLGGPSLKYADPLMTLRDGTVIDLNEPGVCDEPDAAA